MNTTKAPLRALKLLSIFYGVFLANVTNAQLFDVINDGTATGSESAVIPNYVTSSWEATKLDVAFLGGAQGALAEVTSLEAQIDTFITDEGDYKAILENEVTQNNAAIVLNQVALDAADSDLTDADSLLTAANDLVISSTISRDGAQNTVDDILANEPSIDVNDPITHTPEYTAAVDALAELQTALDTNILAQTAAQNSFNAATNAKLAAEDALTASNTRATVLTSAIQRSDERVVNAQSAKETIQTAVTLKEDSFSSLADVLEDFADGITTIDPDTNSIGVNDLDTMLQAVFDEITDEDGINDPVDLTTMPVALDGTALTTADLDPANDPSNFTTIITEAQDALDSITSTLDAETQNQLLNSLANGAFEREAVTGLATEVVAMNDESVAGSLANQITTLNGDATVDGSVDFKIAEALNADELEANHVGIAGTITRNTETGEVHIGENSLITSEVNGVQELYAQDGTGAAIDIDVTNGSDLLIDGVSVATDADVDAEAAARLAADTAIRGEFATEDTAIRGEFAAADAAIQADVDQNELDSDAADTAIRGEFATEDTAIRGEFAAEDAAIRGEFAAADIAIRGELAEAFNADELEDNHVGIAGTITRNTETGEVHIGENSLITNEVNGVQELYAQDGTGAAINIDITNGSDLLIDGVSVATDADVTFEANARAAADAALQTQIDTNRAAIDRNARGIAMVAAMTHTTVLPGMTHALDISAAHFEGETGMALSYSRRISDGVQVNFGTASTTDFEEAVVRAGIGFQW